jgi:hypothetical protein
VARIQSANYEAAIDYELPPVNMQVAPVPICVASPTGIEPAHRRGDHHGTQDDWDVGG